MDKKTHNLTSKCSLLKIWENRLHCVNTAHRHLEKKGAWMKWCFANCGGTSRIVFFSHFYFIVFFFQSATKAQVFMVTQLSTGMFQENWVLCDFWKTWLKKQKKVKDKVTFSVMPIGSNCSSSINDILFLLWGHIFVIKPRTRLML